MSKKWFELDRVIDRRTGDTGQVDGKAVRWDGGERRPSRLDRVAGDLVADTEDEDER